MSPDYSESLIKLQGKKKKNITTLDITTLDRNSQTIGEIKLDNVQKMSSGKLEAALDLKISFIAYWNVVRLRLADQIPLYLRFISRKFVEDDIVTEILKKVHGPGLKMEHVLDTYHRNGLGLSIT
jgi:hypothetical protein